MAKTKMYFRAVEVKENHYILKEDVIKMLRELASTEPTDSRDRLNQMATNLENWTFEGMRKMI